MSLKNLLKAKSLKDLAEIYKYDYEYIYEGLIYDIAVGIADLMEEKGVSKKELASRMGVTCSYVTKILGGSNISLRTLAKVLAALKTEVRMQFVESNGDWAEEETGAPYASTWRSKYPWSEIKHVDEEVIPRAA